MIARFQVNTLVGKVVSVHVGRDGELGKKEQEQIRVELDGIVGDRHRSFKRETWHDDKQPKGTTRRNERQWSAVSIEELDEIGRRMSLGSALSAQSVGANLCLSGVRELSRLPKGSLLRFPSGAVLMVEEYNPPCHDMGKKLAAECRTQSGDMPASTDFSKAAKLTRGVVGVVETTGVISAGDEVTIELYETPAWLSRAAD